MGEDSRAVALDMLVEADAGAGLGYDRRERGLADLKRITPKAIAVQLDQVEGVEEYALVSAVVTDEIERGDAVVIAADSFAIDDAGVRAQAAGLVGRHGTMNPAGRVRARNIMLIARDYIRHRQG
jgi:hypothetical protein